MDCIFCKIVKKEIPSSSVYEDEYILAFKDLNPQAPIHVLVVPKEHITSINEVNKKNADIIAHIFEKIPEITKSLGISDGYRIVSNCGEKAGQSVEHLHFHILGGREMNWPPG